MSFVVCPSCGDEIRMRGGARLGQQLLCPYCDASLEVVEIDPLELDWVFYDEDIDEWGEEWDEEE